MTESSTISNRVDSVITDAIRAELAVEVLPRPASVEQRRAALPVSYTHLTLPTSDLV